MKVHSIFDSLQGEGRFQGFPTQFVRLYGCNLNCSYCDAQSAVSGDTFDEMPINEIADRIIKSDTYDLCVTGGEPMCQEHELTDLLKNIKGKRISIETNGSFDVTGIGSMFPEVFFSIDWKTPSSGSTDFNMKNIEFLKKGRGWIKFVVGNDSDFDFIADKLKYLENTEIFISPVFEKGRQLFEKTAKFVILNRNLRMQVQLHKVLGIE
ncbi:MAG TPA: 4Fe-4S cluster-binding domain-containing protein [bacterium]|nr:4Fe-4S cluster-binding domain-containing protein [bacterium]